MRAKTRAKTAEKILLCVLSVLRGFFHVSDIRKDADVSGSVVHTEMLFSYGTLQLEAVQMATFGRQLAGERDALRAFELVVLKIEDPTVVAISGEAHHTMATFTGRASHVISGTVFAVTPDEIQNADKYEVAAVKRVPVILESGVRAWAYVDARYVPSDA